MSGQEEAWLKECPFRMTLADPRCIRERCWAYENSEIKHYKNGGIVKGFITYRCTAFDCVLGKETYERKTE